MPDVLTNTRSGLQMFVVVFRRDAFPSQPWHTGLPSRPKLNTNHEQVASHSQLQVFALLVVLYVATLSCTRNLIPPVSLSA